MNKNKDCVCKDSKASPRNGECIKNNLKTTSASTTNGAGKGGGGEGFQTPPTTGETKTEGVRFIEKEIRIEKTSDFVYVIAVLLAFIAFVTLVYHWKIRRASMKRKQRSFEDPMGKMDMSSTLSSRSPYQVELTSVTNRESSLYRPYMNSLGCIVSILID